MTTAATINFGIGFLGLLAFLLITRVPAPAREQWASVPAWAWFGGLFGGFYVALVTLVGPRIGAFLARNLGPLTGANRIARENIAAAFPEKTEAERAAILTEAWDNLGRVACEYVHMDRIWDFDPARPLPAPLRPRGAAGEPLALIPVDDIRTADVNEGTPDIVAAELDRWVR